MSFGVFNDQGQRAYFFVAIVLMPFAIAAVILRFLAVSRSAVKYQAEDWLALTSLVLYLTYDATTIAGKSLIRCISGVESANSSLRWKDVVVGDGRDTFGLLHAPEDLVVVRKACDTTITNLVIAILTKRISLAHLFGIVALFLATILCKVEHHESLLSAISCRPQISLVHLRSSVLSRRMDHYGLIYPWISLSTSRKVLAPADRRDMRRGRNILCCL